jgi:cobalamin biosynthesis protein CobT
MASSRAVVAFVINNSGSMKRQRFRAAAKPVDTFNRRRPRRNAPTAAVSALE